MGVGYVLGTRAGREKFDRMVAQARKVWESPTVQEAAGVVQAQATKLYDEGKQAGLASRCTRCTATAPRSATVTERMERHRWSDPVPANSF